MLDAFFCLDIKIIRIHGKSSGRKENLKLVPKSVNEEAVEDLEMTAQEAVARDVVS